MAKNKNENRSRLTFQVWAFTWVNWSPRLFIFYYQSGWISLNESFAFIIELCPKFIFYRSILSQSPNGHVFSISRR